MNKAELVNSVSLQANWPVGATAKIVDGLLAAITKELASGGEIRLPGFGIFKTAVTAARTGRNPKTGQPVAVPAGRKVTFKAARQLKEMI